MDKKYLLMIVLFVLVMFTVNYSIASQSQLMSPLKENISVRVEGTVLRYQRESFWSKDALLRILDKKRDFESNQIKNFKDDLFKYGERGEYATGLDVEFNKVANSTILRCDVLGVVSKTGNSYQATFMWLLRPLGLDFINNKFSESKNGLFWKGQIGSIPTTVKVELPPQNSAYAAWHYPNGHCHAHAWWIE
ncbi:MAG: hypothetical protein J7J10_01690 [Deltaproteobacteria bacterium]|nr:hypothetical protein [Deltaproteobacteria bacterium]